MTEEVVGLDVPRMEEANLTPPVILPEIAGLMIRAYDSHWFPEYIFTTPKKTPKKSFEGAVGFQQKRGRPVFRRAMDSATFFCVKGSRVRNH